MSPPSGWRSPGAAPGRFGWGSQLAEWESTGGPVPVVHIHLRGPVDAAELADGLRWLGERGRRVVVRTRVVLGAAVVEALADTAAVVALELASRSPGVQRALLGDGTVPVVRLLLHAQHLKARGIPVAAVLGPIVEGWHEHLEPVRPLIRHVLAADLKDASVVVAPSPERYGEGLRPFGWAAPLPAVSRIDDRTRHRLLGASVRREAESLGLRVDACGCASFCHLSVAARPYVAIGGSELFPRAS